MYTGEHTHADRRWQPPRLALYSLLPVSEQVVRVHQNTAQNCWKWLWVEIPCREIENMNPMLLTFNNNMSRVISAKQNVSRGILFPVCKYVNIKIKYSHCYKNPLKGKNFPIHFFIIYWILTLVLNYTKSETKFIKELVIILA